METRRVGAWRAYASMASRVTQTPSPRPVGGEESKQKGRVRERAGLSRRRAGGIVLELRVSARGSESLPAIIRSSSGSATDQGRSTGVARGDGAKRASPNPLEPAREVVVEDEAQVVEALTSNLPGESRFKERRRLVARAPSRSPRAPPRRRSGRRRRRRAP